MDSDIDIFSDKFGIKQFNSDHSAYLQKLADEKGIKLHPLIRRGFLFGQKDFDKIIECHQKGNPFYIYTGRGPSSKSMHLGHLLPFIVTKQLQDLFDVKVVIQITDDEKYFTRDQTEEETELFANENIKDIKSIGFNEEKTFIFKNTEYIGTLYRNICRLDRILNINQMKHIFGIIDNDNIGKISFPTKQMAPCFSSSFPDFLDCKMPCLIPCAIDQDVYFRIVRDKASILKEFEPSIVYMKYAPSLQGSSVKMSSSIPTTAIFLSDDKKTIEKKIKGCFSGGRDSMEEHRKYGANLDIDVAYKYLELFLEDDEELKLIREEYGTGKIGTFAVKKRLIVVINEIVELYKTKRPL